MGGKEQRADFDSLVGPRNAKADDRIDAPQAWRTSVPEELYSTAWIADRSEAWLAEQAGSDAPFFLQMSFPDPHHPFTPPGKFTSGAYGAILFSSMLFVGLDEPKTFHAFITQTTQATLALLVSSNPTRLPPCHQGDILPPRGGSIPLHQSLQKWGRNPNHRYLVRLSREPQQIECAR